MAESSAGMDATVSKLGAGAKRASGEIVGGLSLPTTTGREVVGGLAEIPGARVVSKPLSTTPDSRSIPSGGSLRPTGGLGISAEGQEKQQSAATRESQFNPLDFLNADSINAATLFGLSRDQLDLTLDTFRALETNRNQEIATRARRMLEVVEIARGGQERFAKDHPDTDSIALSAPKDADASNSLNGLTLGELDQLANTWQNLVNSHDTAVRTEAERIMRAIELARKTQK